ncbi:MAG: glycosyltransferase [Bacteroidales bacterium]|nr:glycosyltransferase [Bacteroidales bacterium]
MSVTDSLSIIIPSHNRTDLLKLCLQSVLAYIPPESEILVVDDASKEEAVSRTAMLFPGVRVLRLDQRQGFARAANAGIAASHGRIVELLNDDTEVTPNWADTALPYFNDPTVAAVAPLVLQYHLPRLRAGRIPLVDSAGDDYDSGGFAQKRLHGEPAHRMPQLPERVPAVSATAAFYRREALLAVGGFPDDFGAYFEDVDLSCRLRATGYVCWCEPRSIVWHRVSASYGRRPTWRVIAMQSCNEERVFWRNRKFGMRTLFRHGLVLGGKLLYRMAEGTVLPWVSGRVYGLILSAIYNGPGKLDRLVSY